jgi:uncharacterized protein YyaL (SSP411 family)
MNELSKETSPYLLQHANNPVHWKAWNSAALDKAKLEDKLIIVSSGYSACHWCHVMEHESFENDEVAAAMNQDFVAIKVDREERPDIDAVYMKAVQIMTGQGGWPMNIICLPDGRPVWGGTYFPKNNWITSIEQLAEMYRTDRSRMVEYAEKLHQGLDAISLMAAEQPHNELSQELLIPLVEKWAKSFDKDFGGYARAPKFMMPTNWKFLQRYGFQNNDENILSQVDLTLTKMAYGGLFDTVGGGFSRYSVDMEWHVPHFEKMLYDNGQLVSLYADAFKRTKNPLYKEVIEKTIDFIHRELSNGEGGFYSALDADSLNFQGELEEGAFYVWTKAELQNLIGDEFDLFAETFNINTFGHWEHDNYVLIQTESLESIAQKHNINAAALSAKKHAWEKTLFDAREKRPKPRLDDKCLTSWNAIMGKGLCGAFQAIGRQQYLDAAVLNARFISEKLWSADGQLFRNYKNGKTSINGYLEDYAHTIDFFVALYQTTLDEQWLRDAKHMTDYCFSHFYDERSGFFRFTSNQDDALVAAHFETEDNVIPASNSVMAANLYRLSVYFANVHYESVCLHMVKHILPIIDYPSAFSNWLDVLMDFSEIQRELAICANGALAFTHKLMSDYRPNLLIAGTEKTSVLPFLENRFAENKTLFYICHNKTCGLPHDNFEAALKDL